MHPNPAFRATPEEANLGFARSRAFGQLVLNGADGPLISHVPFLLSAEGTVLETHLVRSNPILKALPARAVMIVTGPVGYISPDWYDLPDQVPTWNYIAVHLRGRLEVQPAEALHDLLTRQSAFHEAALAPKPAWTLGKMDPDALTRMMRAIVPVRMSVEDVQGTWKLNQNKPAPARLGAASALEATGQATDRALAARMRAAGDS